MRRGKTAVGILQLELRQYFLPGCAKLEAGYRSMAMGLGYNGH
jgi:hypothetical protein